MSLFLCLFFLWRACAQILPGNGLDFGSSNHSTDLKSVDWCHQPFLAHKFTKTASFQNDGELWTVYEDLTRLDGIFVYESESGCQKVVRKYAEETFVNNATYNPYLGLDIQKIATSLKDLLADRLLKAGEPDEELVRNIVPPLLSAEGQPPQSYVDYYGTVQSEDTFSVSYDGSSLNWWTSYNDTNDLFSKYRYQGHLGGWMPGVRIRAGNSTSDFWEALTFGDVDSSQEFIIPSWYRVAHIKDGELSEVFYGDTYIAFPPFSSDPAPEEYYRALLRFADYWHTYMDDFSTLRLPEHSWADMPKFALAQELVVRPGGVKPRYGAFDRAYAGSEYEGFQDVFTSSVIANLEWGRFTQAANVIDNYFTNYVSTTGRVNMRGPEVPQYGMMLWYLTKYFQYTADTYLLEKHQSKILAIAQNLLKMHDESLQVPAADPSHGLIKGFVESDAVLADADRTLFWQPYFANAAFVARGLRALSTVPLFRSHAATWRARADRMAARLAAAVERSTLADRDPPYVPPLPDVNETLKESFARLADNAPERWPHRLYTELLHARILPHHLADQTHDTMRAYGLTSLGVVANVGTAQQNDTRDLLGFVSYGYAYSLLLQDRVDEFVLFLYSHRYHAHQRGSWVASEVADIVGGSPLFCVPALLTIPAVMKWMLVLEDPDEEVLYLGRGVPSAWVGTGKEVSVKRSPTRWGRVDFAIRMLEDEGVVRAEINFTGGFPERFEVKVREPRGVRFSAFSVNGRPANLTSNESISVRTASNSPHYVVEGKIKHSQGG